MAKLAIKGHSTRGSEVIALLEMLGGENIYNLTGTKEIWYILSDSTIEHSAYLFNENGFSLEEFLKKFPYKVGDKVTHNMGILMNVVYMCWDAECNVIRYDIQSPVDNNYKLKAMLAEHLQPYKEETTEERQYKELRMPLDDDDKLATEVTIDGNKILPPNGYLIGKITQVDNGMLVEYVKQQPSYPKTYEECAQILLERASVRNNIGYKGDLLIALQQLLVCRDAYWKIAGEQMGLGKPWEPDWTKDIEKYVIYPYQYLYSIDVENYRNTFLAFPTEEMRDAFYENFKELIEACKELL